MRVYSILDNGRLDATRGNKSRTEGGMKGWKRMKKERRAGGEEAQGGECEWTWGWGSKCRSEELEKL